MSRTILMAGGHIKDGAATFAATNDDDLREMAIRAVQDALGRAAKRWAESAQAFGKACYARDPEVVAKASKALTAAAINYEALSKASFRSIAQVMHDSGANAVGLPDDLGRAS